MANNSTNPYKIKEKEGEGKRNQAAGAYVCEHYYMGVAAGKVTAASRCQG